MQPTSVVDVGCGLGVWLSVFRDHGVEDIFGVDGAYVEKDMLNIPVERFLAADLQEPLRLKKRFDLVVSLEVGEHLPPACARGFVDSLVQLGPAVLFSGAIPFQGGIDHLNEQWQDYWCRLFQERGYVPIDCVRRKVWNNENVQWYYAQNTILYVATNSLQQYPRLRAELEKTAPSQLSIVHPKRYLATADLRNVAFRKILRVLPWTFILGLQRTVYHFLPGKGGA
jgi:hypothetical protein